MGLIANIQKMEMGKSTKKSGCTIPKSPEIKPILKYLPCE